MTLYRYFKGHEKQGVWRPVEVGPLADAKQAQADIGFATVLLCTESVQPLCGTVSDKAMYCGPFYVDIDDDNINKALRSAKKVLERLAGVGVPDSAVQIWASGKRGFHFTVPQEYFTSPEPVTKLPLIYKAMAMTLSLPDNVDMSVYSSGRGRMWRIPNKKRLDNGNYKIPLLAAELRDMTVELLLKMMAEPRTLPPQKPFVGKLDRMAGLYTLSIGKAAQWIKPIPLFIDPEARAQLGDQLLPPCSMILKSGSGLNKSKGFNDYSMQMAKAVASFAPSHSRDLIAEFARNAPGENYGTTGKRETHCRTAFGIATRDSSWGWSCKSALSVVIARPCDECPLVNVLYEQTHGQVPDNLPVVKLKQLPSGASQSPKPGQTAQQQQAAEVAQLPKIVLKSRPSALQAGSFEKLEPDSPAPAQAPSPDMLESLPEKAQEPAKTIVLPKPKAEQPTAPVHVFVSSHAGEEEVLDDPEPDSEASFAGVGLIKSDDGYSFMEKGQWRRICNFTLTIREYYVEFIEALQQDRRTGVLADVFIKGKKVGSVVLEEPGSWTKAAFISAFSGLANTAFYGKDDDVQKMKEALMQGVSHTAELVRRVHAAGIHSQTVAGKEVFTYVEPGWSIDQYGNEDKYYLAGTLHYSPNLKHTRMPEVGDVRMALVLKAIMGINTEQSIGQMFAWVMACFLKQHFFSYKKEFPLLGVHGNAGSGKTKGSEMLAALHGREYYAKESAINLPSVTPFVLWTTLSSSTTFPMLMDEYNKSKMLRRYDEFGEVFKDVYQGGSVKRGALDANKGAGASKAGARIQDFPLLSPTIIISEQQMIMPALEQRTIQVGLKPADLQKGSVKENYNYVRRNWGLLKQFAKAAYLEALQVPVEQVRAWQESFEPQISMDLHERPHFSYTVLLTGLKFLDHLCVKYEWNLQHDIDTMIEVILSYLRSEGGEISQTKSRSEIDHVLEKMAILAAIPEDTNNMRLVPGTHYYRPEGQNVIYLDGMMCFSHYQRYTSMVDRAMPAISDFRNFYSLLANEAYCEEVREMHTTFIPGRPCIRLNIEGMRLKGIEVEAFIAV